MLDYISILRQPYIAVDIVQKQKRKNMICLVKSLTIAVVQHTEVGEL